MIGEAEAGARLAQGGAGALVAAIGAGLAALGALALLRLPQPLQRLHGVGLIVGLAVVVTLIGLSAIVGGLRGAGLCLLAAIGAAACAPVITQALALAAHRPPGLGEDAEAEDAS